MKLLLTIGLIMLLSACDMILSDFDSIMGQPADTDTIDAELVNQGIAVYRQNYCGSCHTLTIANTRGTFGPPHDNVADDAARYITLKSYSGYANDPAGYIQESLLKPAIFYTPGYESTNHHMPAFTHLSDDDIDALVYLLVNQ